jgi:phosphatidylserine/phosphatidylglycerophosphate/cardiolipin synthase-like enzyme
MPSDPFAALGEFLTAAEAEGLAVQLATGQHVTKALGAVSASRREKARGLLTAAGLGHTEVGQAVAVLRAVAGAKTVHRDLTPVWTMPGTEAKIGHLTGEFHRLVRSARQSVTCATYNFEKTSKMWSVLRESAEQPGVVVTIYVDGDKADAANIKAHLGGATVYRSAVLPTGKPVISHAKFVVIDHEMLLLTSANFSFSAENRNIEFGLLVRDSALARSVESTMASKHGTLYGLVEG